MIEFTIDSPPPSKAEIDKAVNVLQKKKSLAKRFIFLTGAAIGIIILVFFSLLSMYISNKEINGIGDVIIYGGIGIAALCASCAWIFCVAFLFNRKINNLNRQIKKFYSANIYEQQYLVKLSQKHNQINTYLKALSALEPSRIPLRAEFVMLYDYDLNALTQGCSCPQTTLIFSQKNMINT